MPDTHFTITIFIVLLLIASGVAMITKWVPVPYTLALVIVTIQISAFCFNLSFVDKFRIRGGNRIKGRVAISGAKNSALPCMAAAILTADTITLHNIPYVRDIITMRRVVVHNCAGAFWHQLGPYQHSTGSDLCVLGTHL